MRPNAQARMLLWPPAVAAGAFALAALGKMAATKVITDTTLGAAIIGIAPLIATALTLLVLRRILAPEGPTLSHQIGTLRDIQPRWVIALTLLGCAAQAGFLYAATAAVPPSPGATPTPNGPLLDAETATSIGLALLPSIICGYGLGATYLYGIIHPLITTQTPPRAASIITATFGTFAPAALLGLLSITVWPTMLTTGIAGAWLNHTKNTATAITATTTAWAAATLLTLTWLTLI